MTDRDPAATAQDLSPLAVLLRKTVRRDPVAWAAACGIRLRPYQREIALAIKDSIVHRRGLTFVVILPRQSGKNEVQRHLFAWLLCRAAHAGGSIVSVAPTFKPQTINGMERVRQTLDANVATREAWKPAAGFILRFGNARLQFFSGETHARVVGATADLLLSVDEAQDIDPAKFDKEFDPMTASTNATRVFWGTAWTSQTLLARQARIAKEEERADGIRRLFFYTGDDVARLVPEYAAHLRRVVEERGRGHPLVRTQYFNEEIDAVEGMFTPARMALIFSSASLQGQDARQIADDKQPHTGRTYAFCIDAAGMDESSTSMRSGEMPEARSARDSTALSVVEIDLSSMETMRAPTYRVVQREAWTGLNHLTVFGKLRALAEVWNPQHFVIDATGVGEGLWAMLDRAFPLRVIPVKFTQHAKSEIGWKFLSIVETGRFRDVTPAASALREQARLQYACCQSEILPGPAKTLRWGVPEARRGPDGHLVHDDLLLADALVAKLDELSWSVSFEPLIIRPADPLDEMSRFRRRDTAL